MEENNEKVVVIEEENEKKLRDFIGELQGKKNIGS